MNMVAMCDGTWEQNITGALVCDGTLMQVEEGYFMNSWIPPLTYEQSNELLTYVGLIFATVFCYAMIARFLTDQRPD